MLRPREAVSHVTYGPVNDAMYAAELKLLHDWRDIVHGWEHMQ